MISLFLNYGNHSRISIEAERGRYPCRTKLGFAHLSVCTWNSWHPRRLEARSCLANGNGGAGQEAHGITNRDGVIIVDHGSRRKESNLMLSKPK